MTSFLIILKVYTHLYSVWKTNTKGNKVLKVIFILFQYCIEIMYFNIAY